MTTVYAHIDADNNVLYVGQSSWPDKRTRQHKQNAAWWPKVATVEYVANLPSIKARDLERRLIETFDPPHNYMHTAAWRAAIRAERAA